MQTAGPAYRDDDCVHTQLLANGYCLHTKEGNMCFVMAGKMGVSLTPLRPPSGATSPTILPMAMIMSVVVRRASQVMPTVIPDEVSEAQWGHPAPSLASLWSTDNIATINTMVLTDRRY